jgi:hypothetical protein
MPIVTNWIWTVMALVWISSYTIMKWKIFSQTFICGQWLPNYTVMEWIIL